MFYKNESFNLRYRVALPSAQVLERSCFFGDARALKCHGRRYVPVPPTRPLSVQIYSSTESVETFAAETSGSQVPASGKRPTGRRNERVLWVIGRAITAILAAVAVVATIWQRLIAAATFLYQRTVLRIVPRVDEPPRVDPEDLADDESRFVDVSGLRVHYKLAAGGMVLPSMSLTRAVSASSPASVAQRSGSSKATMVAKPSPGVVGGIDPAPSVLLLHGFGASLFSWHEVLGPLSALGLGAVASFDRPAFGLTNRPLPDGKGAISCGKERGQLCPRGCLEFCKLYSYPYASDTALKLASALGSSSAPLVLVGHSAGGLLALDIYQKFPERIKALILVAPAVFVNVVGGKMPMRPAYLATPPHERPAEVQRRLSVAAFSAAVSSLAWHTRVVVQAAWAGIVAFWIVASRQVARLGRHLVVQFLGTSLAVSAIRFFLVKYGRSSVADTFYDPSKATAEVLEGYAKPLRCVDWDLALVQFVKATIAGGFFGQSASQEDDRLTVWDRLARVKVPTLVVAGDKDKVVPYKNSVRVSQGIPDATLVTVANCGHMPHEERPNEFMDAVRSFVATRVQL